MPYYAELRVNKALYNRKADVKNSTFLLPNIFAPVVFTF